jgi:cellulose synthase/poly-beta-1,6-N-acetylglucosamine synthase-like glycosyltransferase
MHWLPAILILPYFIILLKIYRSLLEIKPFNATSEPGTFVSVVVACRNEEVNLPQLLKNISEQDYPANLFEIIIVDDNSTDRTAEVISGFESTDNILIVNNKGTGKKPALKTGIGIASGNLIITTDADCRMGKSWIRTIASFYEKHKPEMIICPVQIESSTGFFGKFQELEFLSLQGITAGSAYAGNGTMCNGANLAFTRDAYLNNTGSMNFGIASGDDIFFLHTLKEQKAKILWLESTSAIVKTVSSPTARSYFKQRRRWISKSISYTDRFSVLLGIVTFVTILLEISLLVATVINDSFLPVFLTIFIIKSVPDFLILLNTTRRYDRVVLMNWFIPVQAVYPLYVILVVFYSLISPENQGN